MITFKANQQGVPKFIGSEAGVEKGQFVEDVEDGFNDAMIKQSVLHVLIFIYLMFNSFHIQSSALYSS